VRMIAARGACRGELAAGHHRAHGGAKTTAERVAPVLDILTETIIAWLRAQAEAAGGVEGILLLLDDIPGLLSPKLFDSMAAPYLARIFEAFDGLVRGVP